MKLLLAMNKTPLQILHISCSDAYGGASRAAYRIFTALKSYLPITYNSSLIVREKLSDNPSVVEFSCDLRLRSQFLNLSNQLLTHIWSKLISFIGFNQPVFNSINYVHHSACHVRTGILSGERLKNAALIHLHWIGRLIDNDTVSIEEIGDLTIPVVWTLHDQWAFCGAEHYTTPPQPGESASSDERYVAGYTPSSRPIHESGPDLNRLTWIRKQRSWVRPFYIVCPSQWMADCARRSALMRDWPIKVIPYPIDLVVWKPFDKLQSRALLGLPPASPLVLFGAIGGTADPRKGADLLLESLRRLRYEISGTSLELLEMVVFGQSRPASPPDLGFPIHYAGRLYDDLSLRLLYSAADVFVIPSRQDNLPNTGLEAHACGTPVVAFRTGGLVDIVDDQVTGALAEPFDPLSLAAAIRWVLEDQHRRQQLGVAARNRAERLWNPARIARLYEDVYREALEHMNPNSF